jgi:hypothetical protein
MEATVMEIRRLRTGMRAAGLVVVCIWPAVHLLLVVLQGINPWRLGGFAVNATTPHLLFTTVEVRDDGQLRSLEESNLRTKERELMGRFLRQHQTLGKLSKSPDAVAEAILSGRPTVDHVSFRIKDFGLPPWSRSFACQIRRFEYSRDVRAVSREDCALFSSMHGRPGQ